MSEQNKEPTKLSFTGFYEAVPGSKIAFVGALVSVPDGTACEVATNHPEIFEEALKKAFPK